MRVFAAACALLVVTSCADDGRDGKDGPPGATGAQGPAGAQGAQGPAGTGADGGSVASAIVWKDAMGKVVPVISPLSFLPSSPVLVLFDGRVWGSYPASGKLIESADATSVYFVDGACADATPYLRHTDLPPARFTIFANGAIRVVPDSLTYFPLVAASFKDIAGTGTCKPIAPPATIADMIKVDSLPAAPATPAFVYAPPLRLEYTAP